MGYCLGALAASMGAGAGWDADAGAPPEPLPLVPILGVSPQADKSSATVMAANAPAAGIMRCTKYEVRIVMKKPFFVLRA
jgi:hypothetical protein